MPHFDIHTCKTCGVNDFESKLRNHNDNWYHPGACIAAQKRKEDDSLNNPYRPVICTEH